MRIGVLTYYRVANFGANLQAVSTYRYLKSIGFNPIFIHYMSQQLFDKTDNLYHKNPQIKCHLDFIDEHITNQTSICFSADDINQQIHKHGINSIIVGSDAVLQHHPLISRIYLKGHRFRRRFVIEHIDDERLFPNPFWGCNIDTYVKMAFMSVSSQNSAFKLFSPLLKQDMKRALARYTYISVRDTWTQQMLYSICRNTYPITPDPVFAFSENAGDIIPTKETILKKYDLPDNYILISFLNANLPDSVIRELKNHSSRFACVALPSPLGMRFNHNYDYAIPLPLSPIDWYALIKHSKGYIGNNMHPIVVALENGVPCYSVDNYSNFNILKHPKNDGSSKIMDLLQRFDLQDNHIVPFRVDYTKLAQNMIDTLEKFPKEKVSSISATLYEDYKQMMDSILNSFQR